MSGPQSWISVMMDLSRRPQQMRKQKVLVLVGDALLLGWVAEALAEALLAVAEADEEAPELE